jgi:hypothetical protein
MAPRSDLVTYVYNSLKSGYALDAIKQQLLTQGFPLADINAAVDYVYATYYYSQGNDSIKKDPSAYKIPDAKKIGVPEIAVFILLVFGVALIGFAVVFMIFSNKIKTIETPVVDNSEIDNSGNSNVNVPIDDNSGNVVINRTKPSSGVPINNTGSGNNPIFVNNGNGGSITTSNPDNSNTNYDIVNSGSLLEEDPTHFDSNTFYSTRQIEIAIDNLGLSNPDEAAKFCTKYANKAKEEYCYVNLATKSEMPRFCEKISTNSIKDDCYLEMVISDVGNPENCPKIANAYKRESCVQLIAVKTIKIPSAIENTAPTDSNSFEVNAPVDNSTVPAGSGNEFIITP